jgi:hypothetical protein
MAAVAEVKRSKQVPKKPVQVSSFKAQWLLQESSILTGENAFSPYTAYSPVLYDFQIKQPLFPHNINRLVLGMGAQCVLPAVGTKITNTHTHTHTHAHTHTHTHTNSGLTPVTKD